MNKISIVLSLLGRYELVANELKKTINSIYSIQDFVELVIVTDHPLWLNTPLMQILGTKLDDINIDLIDNTESLPAKLFNAGINIAKENYIICCVSGCIFDYESIKKVYDAINTRTEYEVFYLKENEHPELPFYPEDSLRYGWCMALPIYKLCNMIISKNVYNSIGMFNESKILQKHFDWDFILRTSKYYPFCELNTKECYCEPNFVNYPYLNQYNVSQDLVQRYIVRDKHFSRPVSDEISFLGDLDYHSADYLNRKILKNNSFSAFKSNKAKYKIAIMGGFWEYVHNQLSFFNYLDLLAGEGFGTYKVLLEHTACIDNIKDCDILIISRCRSQKTVDLIKYCTDKKIKTLYMLDDNWLTVAKDWPEQYSELFSPGKPDYEFFLDAVRSCDATLVFNKYLEEDIKPYAKKIYKLPVNFNPKFYESDEIRKSNEIIIGYSGSIRYSINAFKALAKISSENDNIIVLLFGSLTESQLSLFDGLKLIHIGNKSYFDYCKQITKIKPDILIAPLDNSRTSMSKCPNKYLEISASGAVGIYSDLYPYNDVITNKYNGILVENDTVSNWIDSINLLLNDKELFMEIKKNSEKDIQKHYATDVVKERFCLLIDSLMKEN